MHVDLHHFLARLVGTVAMTLVPVVFTAFVTLPLSLNRHPGEPAARSAVGFQHMT